MKPDHYTLICNVKDEEKLGLIVSVLARNVISFKIEARYKERQQTKSSSYNKCLTWASIAKHVKIGDTFTRKEAEDFLTNAGFAISSFSPLRSKLIRSGIITHIEDSTYRRLK